MGDWIEFEEYLKLFVKIKNREDVLGMGWLNQHGRHCYVARVRFK